LPADRPQMAGAGTAPSRGAGAPADRRRRRLHPALLELPPVHAAELRVGVAAGRYRGPTVFTLLAGAIRDSDALPRTARRCGDGEGPQLRVERQLGALPTRQRRSP